MTSDVWAYTPKTNTWSAVASFPVATGGAACSSGADGYVYVFDERSGGSGKVYRYDPKANAWSTRSAIPTVRPAATVLGPDHRIYVVGAAGYGTTGPGLDIYDPPTNTWKVGATPPGKFFGVVTATIGADGLLYAVTGNTMVAYSFTRLSWTTVGPTPAGTGQITLGAGSLYYAGGYRGRFYITQSATWKFA